MLYSSLGRTPGSQRYVFINPWRCGNVLGVGMQVWKHSRWSVILMIGIKLNEVATHTYTAGSIEAVILRQ